MSDSYLEQFGIYQQGFEDGFNQGFKKGKAEAKADMVKECKYILDCGMGKKKSIEHLILILEKDKKNEN